MPDERTQVGEGDFDPSANHVRYLGLFDFLGFKDHVRRHTLGSVVQNLTKVVRPIVDIATTGALRIDSEEIVADPEGRLAEPIVFSDTILLYSKHDDREGFVKLVTAARNLVGISLQAGVPVRGAVTRGELFVSADRNLYVGRGLIDAYELEQSQNWAGAILDGNVSAVSELRNYVASLRNAGDLFQYVAPRNNASELVDCIGWPLKLGIDADRLRRGLLILNPTPDGRALDKIAETVKFFEAFKRATTFPAR